MLRTSLAARYCGACAGVVAALVFCAESLALAAPINGGVQAPTPDVFYNFYVSPRPVPPRVGHTWITYPPFMAHEFLYRHHRRYIRPAGAMGMQTVARGYWW